MDQNNTVYQDHNRTAIAVDLRDLCAYLFLRWKSILASIIAFVILGCVVAFLHASTPASYSERLENARMQLTAEQASDIESLRARYVGYQEYQRSLQDDYARYLSNAARASDYVLLNASYYITSSLDGLDVILSQTLLSEDDYNEMRSITSEDEAFTSVYGKVRITHSRSYSVIGTNNMIVNVEPSSPNVPMNYYFLITLYGSSEEECASLLTIVDAAMARSVKSLKTIDPELVLQAADKEFSHNTRDFVNQQITENKTILNDVETQMLNLTNNRISKLSAAEKSYYDLISIEQDDTPTVKHISWKKWSMVGVVLGAILSIGVLFFRYLFDGKIKIPVESEVLFHTNSLQRVSIPGKKNLFGRFASRLMGSDQMPIEEKISLIAADLQLLMEKADCRYLYLLCDSANKNATQIASLVKEHVAMRDRNIELIIGNPCTSVAELEHLSESDCAIVFTELKNSSRSLQTKWSELCVRYNLQILGNIAIETCW